MNVLKILRINTFLQVQHGMVYLDGVPIVCVALDGTCTLGRHEMPDVMLTNEQIDDLFQQTFVNPVGGTPV